LKPKASAGRTCTPQRPATTRDSKDHLCRKHRWPAGLSLSQAAPAAASACPAPSDTTKTSCKPDMSFSPNAGGRGESGEQVAGSPGMSRYTIRYPGTSPSSGAENQMIWKAIYSGAKR